MGRWLERLRGVAAEIPSQYFRANQTYCGRGFAEALIASGANPLYVISAGLGLVQSTDRIPAYGLTVAGQAKDSIAAKCPMFDLAGWWDGLRGSPYSRGGIREVFGGDEPSSVVVVALPRSYFAMIEGELGSLHTNLKHQLRIVGIPEAQVTESLQQYVMPIDERLDGPDSPLRGTRADFPQRAGRFFIEAVISRLPWGQTQRTPEAGVRAYGWLAKAGNLSSPKAVG